MPGTSPRSTPVPSFPPSLLVFGRPVEQVADHVARCSADLRFFEAPLRIARNSKLPQALVTVNPDAFSSLVVPSYDLAQRFKPIVTSWEERTLDKGELAARALELLGLDLRPSEALLVDNKSPNVDAWESRGGRGYVFRNEKTFVADLCGPLEELASSAASNAGQGVRSGPDPSRDLYPRGVVWASQSDG
jgi:hypothetical protein